MTESKRNEYQINYGAGIIEKCCTNLHAESKISKYRSIKGGRKVNTETGEVIKSRKPLTKRDCKNVPTSMIHEGKKLLYNALNFIENGEIFFVTGCFEDRVDTPKEKFEKALNAYLKSLRDMCKRKNPESPLKYILVKEHANIIGYHIHGFIWHENREDPLFTPEELKNKWKYGSFKVTKINSKDDLFRLMFYCFNYSFNCSNGFSKEKILKKREGLDYFSSTDHLFKQSNNLMEPQKEEIYMIDKEARKICETNRNFGQGGFYNSTFYELGGEIA